MIVSYRDKRTRRFANGETVQAFQGFARQAYKRLEILDAATSLEDLRALPSNRLEALGGDRSGQYSIRINAQWRICFEWKDGRARTRQRRDRGLSQMSKRMTRPAIHPGEILADELEELNITPTELARQLSVPAEPDHADHPGETGDHGRYGASARPLVRNERAVLAEPAIGL